MLTGVLLTSGRILQGYCPAPKVCKSFAVSLASFGSAAAAPRTDPVMGSLAAYLQPLCGLPSCIAADGAHAPITSWFWDSWASGPSARLAAGLGLGLAPYQAA